MTPRRQQLLPLMLNAGGNNTADSNFPPAHVAIGSDPLPFGKDKMAGLNLDNLLSPSPSQSVAIACGWNSVGRLFQREKKEFSRLGETYRVKCECKIPHYMSFGISRA